MAPKPVAFIRKDKQLSLACCLLSKHVEELVTWLVHLIEGSCSTHKILSSVYHYVN